MDRQNITVDTNVLVAGLRSRRGTSFKLLELLDQSTLLQLHLSVPLVLEYESVLKRLCPDLGLSTQDIDDVIDYLCHIGEHHQVHYLWRPFLRDPKDDMVLELAVISESDYIITFNLKDFSKVEKQFNIVPITPGHLLEILKEQNNAND